MAGGAGTRSIITFRTFGRFSLRFRRCAALLSCLAVVCVPALARDVDAETVVLTHARVYTGVPGAPWAEALAFRGDRLVYVGSMQGAPKPGDSVRAVDLHGAFVMSGLIDAHTHPGLVAVRGSGDPAKDRALALPEGSREELFDWLRRFAREHPSEEPLFLRSWDVATFLPEGPHRKDLDAIFPTRPVLLFDNSGHSTWANSAMLAMLGIDAQKPDLSPGLSMAVRDASGEPTGWLKESVAMPTLLPMLVPPDPVFRARLKQFLGYLSSRGVTTVFDAGNYIIDQRVYSVLSDLDRAGELPLRYYGSYHVWRAQQLDDAIRHVLELRAKYGGKNLHFNTIKIHLDGLAEVMTARMLAPYAIGESSRGGILFDTERLVGFLLKLDQAGIDVHVHTVGDGTARDMLDAVQEARRRLSRPLQIQVTLSHLFVVSPEDIPRFRQLDVHANFTPQWFSGVQYGHAAAVTLGPERANRQQMAGSFVRTGANVTFASDVVSSGGIPRSDPFVGIQMSMTRRELDGTLASDRDPHEDEALTLPQALAAYTLAGARQLAIADEVGTLEVGKRADLVVLGADPFKVPAQAIKDVTVQAVFHDGKMVAGVLP
jgi:predicted amidohydrolase YtcJ